MDEDPTVDEGARAKPRGVRLSGQRYRAGALLGRGGMGEVLEATDEQFDRDVAIKRMLAKTPTDAQVQRFLREARIQGQLEHPAIVPIYELGRDVDGRPFFAMKKLAGTTLVDILGAPDPARFPLQRLLRAFADVCLAIELAHTRGVIHRDLKPHNIVLGDFGETYVLDWGVAKIIGETDDAMAIDADAATIATATGAAVGTAGYMAPEQARGETDIDARADIYALGCVLFEILAGERLHPKGAAGLASATDGIDGRPSNRAPDRDIPPELDSLCERATRVDRDARPSTARELGDIVQRYLDGDRDLKQRRVLAAEQLAISRAAYDAGDHRTAMRAAGRALALDPTQHGAGELISRLMLEPPRELPSDVQAELAAAELAIARNNAASGAVPNLGYLLFLPVFALAGTVDIALSLILAACALVSFAYLWALRRPNLPFLRLPVVIPGLAMIVVVGRATSPFMLGIPLATLTLIGLLTGLPMRLRTMLALSLAFCAAVLVPWLAERADILSSTMTIASGVLTLHAPVFANEAATYIVLCVGTIAIVLSGGLIVAGNRRNELHARRRLLLQSWQLRQLVS